MEEDDQIIINQSENGDTHIDVKFTGETLWLSQQQFCELYATDGKSYNVTYYNLDIIRNDLEGSYKECIR